MRPGIARLDLFWSSAIVGIAWLSGASASADMVLTVPQPQPRQFVQDLAKVISAEDAKKIQEIGDKLLTDKATPLIVVTIESMSRYGGAGLRIETFATLLFNQWQIGLAKFKGQDWNTGILLLVSVEDRKARIELGAGWAHEKDELCQQIMQEHIIPQFKQGNFSGGILAGVEALDAMARDKPLPQAPTPWWVYALIAGAIGLAIFTIVSMIRRGTSGWAWLMWGLVFAALGYLLYSFLKSSTSGGAGYSGGSFGGGFSGGGGASGSW